MSIKFNIRPLCGEDWMQFRAVRLKSLRDYPGNFGAFYADELQLTQEQWQARLDDQTGRVFGLFEKDYLIGINAVVPHRDDVEGKTALMIMWFMRAEYQGQGLFHDLVKAGLDWAESEKRFERILVSHRDGNDASRKSNQKNGFDYIGRKAETWPDGKMADSLMYEKRFER